MSGERAALERILVLATSQQDDALARIHEVATAALRNGTASTSGQLVLLGTVATATEDREQRRRWRKRAAELVFSYWQARTGHTRTLYDEKRETLLVRALTQNRDDVSELLYVVDGMLRDPWPQRRNNDGIKYLFRDRESIERFARMAPGYEDGDSHPVALEYGLTTREAG